MEERTRVGRFDDGWTIELLELEVPRPDASVYLKEMDRARSILGEAAPPVAAYWDRMLERLLTSNWNAALPEAA